MLNHDRKHCRTSKKHRRADQSLTCSPIVLTPLGGAWSTLEKIGEIPVAFCRAKDLAEVLRRQQATHPERLGQ